MTNDLPHSANPSPIQDNPRVSLFVVSVLGLFLELLLIRWIGTEIRIFAYLQNTVLVVCFLGMGMGCFTSRQPIHLRRGIVALFLLVVVLAIPFTRSAVQNITAMLSILDDLLIWQGSAGKWGFEAIPPVTAGLVLTFGLMLLLWETFLPIGRILGRTMDDHPQTIQAYSINVLGSLTGIGVFILLSAASTPPVVWFVTACCLYFLLIGRLKPGLDCGILIAIVAASWWAGREPEAVEVISSPYQKLALTQVRNQGIQKHHNWPGEYLILVNNAGYQGIIDLSEETVRGNPGIPVHRRGLSQYDIPLLFRPHPDRVLIVGAGAGNDVAGALRGGAKHITAVEIDSAIIDLGRRYHPERPYDSPRVSVVNDDARSYFATTDQTFDLIIFGLLDSHTTTSMTNARLDHYVYTRESLNNARSLLAPGGVMVLSFEAVKPFIADRMAGCLRTVFGDKPLCFRVPQDLLGWGGVMFVAGDKSVIDRSLARHPGLARHIAAWRQTQPVPLSYTTSIATDDWPYIYLQRRQIPVLYYLLAGLLGALAVYCGHRTQLLRRPMFHQKAAHWHFFFLGAAFLLLEVQNISKASVVLGNTWSVNAVIICGILLMILLANLIIARFPKWPDSITTFGLIGSCLGLYFLDLSRFGFLPYTAKAVVVGTLATSPMLFSGMLFIRSFSTIERKDLALGANMYGALAGGILQSITFLVGIKTLLLLVAALYAAALLTRPKTCQPDEITPTSDDAFNTPPQRQEDSLTQLIEV